MMGNAFFILSTGRCGTQWIAAQLAAAYGARYHVEHEPLHSGYQSRRLIRGNSFDVLPPADTQPIRAHLARIERCLEQSNYLECGHPCWGALPLLAKQLQGSMRVIHLTRHPLPTALSWLTHGAFQTPLLPHLIEKILVSPDDEGLAFPEYRSRWAHMTPFEKCLYYWLEVNALGTGARYDERIGVPCVRISYENLFGGDGLEQLLDFLELPRNETLRAARIEPVDQFRYLTMERPALDLVQQHPRVLEMAGALGYAGTHGLDIPALTRRYTGV